MDNKLIASKSSIRLEEVRRAIKAHPDTWERMAGLNGVNKRWLRAFASGQITRPPADRFMSIERWLVLNRLLHNRV